MREKLQRIKPYLSSILTILFVFGCTIFVMCYHSQTTDFLLSFMPEGQWNRALLILLFYALQGVIPIILYNVVALASSMMLKLPLALTVNCVGTIIGMIIPYLLGKYLNRRQVDKILSKHKKLHQLCKEKSGKGFLFAYGLRVSGISNMLLGIFFGSTGMPLGQYLLSNFLGVLPIMLCLSIFGTQGNLRSLLFWIILAIDLLLTAAIFFIYRIFDRKKAQAEEIKQ